MGGCVSVTPEEREAKQRSAIIDREIRQAAKDYENTIKILLLGKSLISLATRFLFGTTFEVVCVCVCVCPCNREYFYGSSYKLKVVECQLHTMFVVFHVI